MKGDDMKIGNFMTTKVLKVRMDDSFGTMRDILQTVNFHHLLVVDGDKLVGVISDRDLWKAMVPMLNAKPGSTHHGINLEARKVHQFMTRDPVTVNKDTLMSAAARLMLKHNISCLPVVTPNGDVEGVITMRDILRVLATQGG